MHYCEICKNNLPIEKFEISRGKPRKKCIQCRALEQKKMRIYKGLLSPQKTLIEKTKLRDCKGMCQGCNNYIPHLLTFDHLTPIDKARTIVKKKNNINEELGEYKSIKSIGFISINKLEIELQKKHIWLCHNCHAVKTYDTKNSNTHCIGDIINQELKRYTEENVYLWYRHRFFPTRNLWIV
jgi:predicted nucleic-acid-binding Zn-ribbon protein